MVAFIASPDAGWINVQNIIVNGGMIVNMLVIWRNMAYAQHESWSDATRHVLSPLTRY